MMDPILRACLQPLLRRQRRCRFWMDLAWVWTWGTALGVVWLGVYVLSGWAPVGLWASLTLGGAVGLLTWRFWRRPGPDLRRLALQLEERHPQLEGRLLTAVQQEAGTGAEVNYLQDRLVTEVLRLGQGHRWIEAVPRWRLLLAHCWHVIALALFAGLAWQLSQVETLPQARGLLPLAVGVQIAPGDTELEKGQSLVVMAEFGRSVPTRVELVVRPTVGLEERIPMVRSLAERMFGVTVPAVMNDLVYYLEYEGQRSREFVVDVFELPRLEKSDVELAFPEYTGRAPSRVEETRRVSAVEGSDLTLSLVLNKPVVVARLVPSTEGETLELVTDPERPIAQLNHHRLLHGGTYRLQLTDAEGRTNRAPPQFVFQALENRVPELKLARPIGDIQPSALEEITFEGSAWDDFGLLSYGYGWARVGETDQRVSLGGASAAGVRQPVAFSVALEEVGVKPDDLLLWYLWAEDRGPDGQPRLHTSDLVFGEVRPFEEIFREGQSSGGQSQQAQSAGESQGQGPAQQLSELQKEILNATWNLRRNHRAVSEAYEEEARVVRDSQAEALSRAEQAGLEASDPQSGVLWSLAAQEMEEAVERLDEALRGVEGLSGALTSEQGAYQALLRLREREFQVSQGQRSPSAQRGSQGQQAMQRQLDQLELTQSENRYETERQASEEASRAEQGENLQILNRLKELARRQSDLNERLQELQTALAAADEEEEREQIRRELKRLQEDEQRMLADVDELQQRMDRAENPSEMTDRRQQLEETREELRRASEATERGEVSQALASGTRAQRQMEELRDSLRQESASAFAEDLRRMRTEARELVRRQESIQEQVDELQTPQRKVLTDRGDREDLFRGLEEQRERVESLVRETARVSADAEIAEPLVSTELYDALREFTQAEASHLQAIREELIERGLMTVDILREIQEQEEQEGGRSVALTETLLRADYLSFADEAEAQAREGIGVLNRGVERAAERVLGDDTEALRRAGDQLDEAADQVEREMAQARQPGSTQEPEESAPSPEPSEEGGAAEGQAGGEQPAGQGGEEGQEAAEQRGQMAGEGGERRENPSGRTGQGGGQEVDLERLLGGELTRRDGGVSGPGGPITGGDFGPWSDRLREAEELLDLPDLRDAVASARERARVMRQDYRQKGTLPDWESVQLEIVGPLVEVRREIAAELARREPGENLAPIDRDPVPTPYLELVRRYYEDLGRSEAR